MVARTDKPTHSQELQVSLPSDTEIVMTRVFHAPRRLVFEAHSKAEHIQQWWGPRRHRMVSCEMDFRPDGAWRYVLEHNGKQYVFHGVYKEIRAPEGFVWTFEFESEGAGDERYTFNERDGWTTLTARSVFPSKQARDAILKSGMQEGAAETWDRLAEHLATMS